MENRSKLIDVLRAVAVILVMIRHLAPYPGGGSLVPNTVRVVTNIVSRGGWIGVDLFFVLSGFLVSGLLFREYQKSGAIHGARFLIRRAFKIYPAFWVLIALTPALPWLLNYPITARRLLAELLFVQNYTNGVWGHTWSLAVEEHFYLLLVLACTLMVHEGGHNPFRIIPRAFPFFAVACLTIRSYNSFFETGDLYFCFFATHIRIDSLLFGVLLSYYYHFHREPLMMWAAKYRAILIACGVIGFVPAFIFEATSPLITSVGFSVLYLSAGALLLGLLTVRLPDTRLVNFLAFLGVRSYSIYLWHVFIFFASARVAASYYRFRYYWPLYYLTCVIGSFGFGVFMAWIVELPLLRIRDRWIPSQAASKVSSNNEVEVLARQRESLPAAGPAVSTAVSP